MVRLLLWYCLLICWSCGSPEQDVKSTAEHHEDKTVASSEDTLRPPTIAHAEEEPKKDSLVMETITDAPPIQEKKPVPAPSPKYPEIAFKETTIDFGQLIAGDKTSHTFEFENRGDGPLEIKNVHVSCGCTFPSYPFLPLAPGEKGHIGLTYNSAGKEGQQRATARVITNDPKQKEVVLSLVGAVAKETQ
ncbi:MAG: DUF1573 domain-containing protein [Saprospiraceae bacterium]|nr:DUF1573 domain-containing protein [Saprospiraceae bacterium]